MCHIKLIDLFDLYSTWWMHNLHSYGYYGYSDIWKWDKDHSTPNEMAILSFIKNSKTNHKNCHKVAKMLKENVVIEHLQTMLVADKNIGI